VRALAHIYELYPSETQLRDYIRAFISVQVMDWLNNFVVYIMTLQYNAVLDLASDGQGDYAGSWTGGTYPYSFMNETYALNVLLGGITVSNVTNTTDSTTSLPSGKGSGINPHSQSHIVGITAGITGGVALLLLTVTSLILYLRAKRKRRTLIPGNAAVLNEQVDYITHPQTGVSHQSGEPRVSRQIRRLDGEINSLSAPTLIDSLSGPTLVAPAPLSWIRPSSSMNPPSSSAPNTDETDNAQLLSVSEQCY
jgi:hypothetical protein